MSSSLQFANPAVDIETSATSSNLAIILAAAVAYAVTANKSDDDKKLRVDNLTITGAKLTGKLYPLSTMISMTLPDIKMNSMGADGDGMTQADFVQVLLTEVANQATTSALHP